MRAWGDSAADFARLLPQASGPWLAVSGGGSDGAFGGGLLAGWSQAGNRPEFAVVTGVSIGALIAPYAFLGAAYDEELRKNFTTITAADVFEDRMTRDSLFDYWPLRRLIEQRVTAKLLSDIAAEHRRGRRLLVATTNLDAGRRVVWNMGAIAERGDDKALKLFRDVLLASCSIPGFFSPVAIDVEANGKQFQEMHGDGTITAPFFVVPESMLSAVEHGVASSDRPALRDRELKACVRVQDGGSSDCRRSRPLHRRGAHCGVARRNHADAGRSAAATESACASRISTRRSIIRRAARLTASTCKRCLISASSKARRAPPSRTCCPTGRCGARTTRADPPRDPTLP